MNWNKLIKDTILCIKYPFLLPRNRITGNHYNDWDILDYCKELYKLNTVFLTIDTCKPEDIIESCITDKYGVTITRSFCSDIFIMNNTKVQLIRDYDTVYLFNLDRRSVLFEYRLPKNVRDVYIKVYERSNEKEVIKSYSLTLVPSPGKEIDIELRFYTLILNKWTDKKISLIKFYHNWVLAFFHCLPTHGTELDSLDKGWRIAFGEQLCKDMRKAMLKSGGIKYLFKFRFQQIKEKYAALEIYSNTVTKEVDDVFKKYKTISKYTCISCGKPAKYRTRGYVLPYCEDCIGKNINNCDIIK